VTRKRSKSKSARQKHAQRRHFYTVTVGKKPSKADFFINSEEEVLELLQSFAKVSTKASASR
jgi:hypothetical protein